jgi:muramoyltetrapeptide carboxypeptidase
MSDRRKFLRNASLAAAALAAGKLTAQKFDDKKIIDEPRFILPPRIKAGDTIALTAPAGAIFNDDSIQKATTSFEGQGFRVKHCGTLTQKYGYLAGTDEYRATELNNLFEDSSVQAIVAMRGGWGCARMLDMIDYEKIIRNPKIFSGFSDITSLLLTIYSKTNLITFHGPVGNSTLDGFTMENFLRIVKDGEALNMVQPATDPVTVYVEGKTKGRLFGGNLTVLCSMLGTGYLPELHGALLFLEETEEEPYQIDRMLTQLEIVGPIGTAAGIIFGKCAKCEAEEPDKSFTIDEVFQQKFGKLANPVFAGFNFGHIKDKFTFPMGGMASMDTADSSVKLVHPCVV